MIVFPYGLSDSSFLKTLFSAHEIITRQEAEAGQNALYPHLVGLFCVENQVPSEGSSPDALA